MTRIARQAADHAIALLDLAPHGVNLHFSLIATRTPVEVKWHRSPYRRFVGTVKYGGVDMEKRPFFWRTARFDLLAQEFVEHSKAIQAGLLVRLTAEVVSVSWRGRPAQMLARRRVLRTSAVHRLR